MPTSREMRAPKKIVDRMSRPWSSVPSGNDGSPPSIHAGGFSEFDRSSWARSKGLCGATQGANIAAPTQAANTTAATIAQGEWRKLHATSLSQESRRAALMRPPMSVPRRTGTTDAQPWIDGVIEQIDDQVDDHENQGDQAQVRGHHRDVGVTHRLDEQQPHPRPLEHLLGDDRERDDRAELQAGDRDHRHQRVLERMPEVDRPVGEAARARELDVIC